MSQKEGKFQSKSRFGGQKSGGRSEGRPEYKGKSAGRSFGKKFEGDKGDRPERSSRPYDRDSRPPRERSFGDKPYKKKEFSGEGRRDFKSEGRRDYKPEGRKSFGDRDSRPPRNRDFDSRPPRQDREGGESRRDHGGEKPAFEKREFRRDDSRKNFAYEGRREFSKENRGASGEHKPFHKDSKRAPFRKEGSRDRYQGRDRGGEGRRDFKSESRRDHGGERPSFKKEWRDEPRASSGAETRQKLKSDRPSYGAPSSAYLYGIHAVSHALSNPKRLHQRLLCTHEGYESLQEAWAEALEDGIKLPEVIYVEKEDLERLLPRDAVHQDVLLDCQPLEEMFLSDILVNAPDNARILILDQVTDPHNVGAILRSAAAFGALAVIMQKLHAPDVTGTLAKAASGAVEHVPIVREVNLSRTLELLKEAGFFCLGLAEEGKQTLAQLNMTGKTALVLGAEGTGLRRLVAENCDELVKLPTQNPIASLNVSNAAAVALYELVRKG